MSSTRVLAATTPREFRLRLAIGLSLVTFALSGHAAPPDRPGDLRVEVYSDTTAELFWSRSSDDSGVLGYEVTLDDRRIGRFDALSYLTNGLNPGQEYSVQVVAIDDDGERSPVASTRFVAGKRSSALAPPSGGSTPAAGPSGPAADPDSTADPTDLAGAAGAPVSPTGARLTVYSRSAAELVWTRVPGPIRVRVLRDGKPLGMTDGNSFYDGTRVAGRSYRYELFAVDPAGRLSAPTVLGDASPPATSTPDTASAPDATAQPSPAADTTPVAVDAFPARPSDLSPDGSLYGNDGYGTVDVIRVDLATTVRNGPCTANDDSGCTLDDVLADTDKTDDLKIDIPVHFQADDFADDGSLANAGLRQRGGGSRRAPQKSFRVKLDSKTVLWRNERFLQLNKHPYESSRFRNKLAFDLMQGVPHLPAFRTQFANLWIDDGDGAIDNGLYTHVERFNDDWLKRRGLPGDGNLYSAEDFRFAASDLADVAVDARGEPLDEDRFESSLEIEEGKDHRALVSMLRAVQDRELDFETVLDRHFNRNNLLAWTAFNLLVRQDDATRHNFKLYNPSGSERFYIIPWDYDAVFGEWTEPPGGYSADALEQRLDFGYALGHRNDLLDRYYRTAGLHRQVLAAIRELRLGALADASIQETSDNYHALVSPFESRAPDQAFNPDFNTSSGRNAARSVAANENAIRDRFSIPLPPTLLTPVNDGRSLQVRWTPALDVTGGTLSYDLEIADSADFEPDSILVTLPGIADAPGTLSQSIDLDRLGRGRHYARLSARVSSEPSRYWQVASNRLSGKDGIERRGLIAFEVP